MGSCSCLNKEFNDRHVTGFSMVWDTYRDHRGFGRAVFWWVMGTRYQFMTEWRAFEVLSCQGGLCIRGRRGKEDWGCVVGGRSGGDSDPVLGFFLPTIVVSSPHKIGGGYDRRELAKIGTSQESRF